MEHYNPLLGNGTKDHKFITCGEIMLRLTPPNYEKIRMASSFEASYGGSEANIALALANLGIDSTFFSVVPNNSLGKSAVRMLRSNDVHCTPMILATQEDVPTHRLGTYYLETGYGIRASKVTYDRKHSAITEYDFSRVDLDALLDRLARSEDIQSAEFLSIFYGEDVTEEQAQEAAQKFTDACPNAEVNLLPGGQPVYYYMISAE